MFFSSLYATQNTNVQRDKTSGTKHKLVVRLTSFPSNIVVGMCKMSEKEHLTGKYKKVRIFTLHAPVLQCNLYLKEKQL